MVYICPVQMSWGVTAIIFSVLSNFDLFHIQEVKDTELVSVLKTADIESGEFPVVFISHECTETEIVERCQTTVEVHDVVKLGYPDYKKNDQIIILGNVAHILITLV